MDERQIDEQTSHPADEQGSGRAGLRSWRAVALAGVAALFPAAAEARRKRKKKKRRPPPVSALPTPPPVTPPAPLCTRCPKLCETPHVVLCKPRTETERCACTWTTTGKPVCVNTITIFDTATCQTTNECERDADCGAGQACILVDDKNCCPAGKAGNLCFPICTV